MNTPSRTTNGLPYELKTDGLPLLSPQEKPTRTLDLRSDVVTPPTPEMWDVMHAEGFGGTPLDDAVEVRRLEEFGARLVGKEEAYFVPTGTVANILALMTLGERGTQVVLERKSHIATSEEWGLAYICGLVPHLLDSMSPIDLMAALRQPSNTQKLRTCLLCLENSHTNSGGTVITPELTVELSQMAQRQGAAVHLDGARLFNAAVALGVSPEKLAEPVDTVAINLNKGLSAPFGALLCGRTDVIAAARKNARRIGAATIHKSATLAAAALVGLKNRDHLADDNRRAYQLATALQGIPGLKIELASVQTNLVRAQLSEAVLSTDEFRKRMENVGILVLVRAQNDLRFVLHRGINDNDVTFVARAVAAVLA